MTDQSQTKAVKVEAYEHFVNEKLKSDLARCFSELDVIYSEIAEYEQLKDFIEKLQFTQSFEQQQQEIKPLKTKVDLGCNFYAKAIAEDTSMIYVSIGYGFHLEMKHDEALRFIAKKCGDLQRSADILSEQANEIKANIKFVLEGLRELQELKHLGRNEDKLLKNI